MTTKTEQALALVAQGKTVRQAARLVDVSESAVHSALKKQKAQKTGVCPCCGQRMPIGTSEEPAPYVGAGMSVR